MHALSFILSRSVGAGWIESAILGLAAPCRSAGGLPYLGCWCAKWDIGGLTYALDAAVSRVRLHSITVREAPMKFLITALDTSGSVKLERESVPAAVKKAAELISDGCWDVEIITPDGAAYNPDEFEQLKERVRA